ncbi:uncharacterized protein F5891DRAFT_1041131 [Suillus fuscotomentosus]|uniref:Uncharacterized protein n=1 Tax=Suillus fuscotomentosus TaxID=1912939 RepID=A0AAD4HKQ3_9AGAM|nr:uncharacterized protein F5891DRAFT_1041131 [Suillus fuscotomentosus]KAG1899024.1 hypothetical protein F5891DRAFT_1041131 [Suillus fuscotomentosus]
MGNGPSIFVRTPQEHLEHMWKNPSPLAYSCPPRHVRVYLLPEWTQGKNPIKEPWAALKNDFALEPTGELNLKKVKGKWALERCSAIDLERMQPFEEKCKGRLSPLALKVLADSKGVVWMYEPTPSEDTVSIRADRLRIVRQYDAAVERVMEATLGRISKLLDNGVVGESVSHHYPEHSGADTGIPDVPQEAHSKEAPVKGNAGKAEGSKTSVTLYQQQRQLIFFAALLFLFYSGALGRYAQFGRDLTFGW